MFGPTLVITSCRQIFCHLFSLAYFLCHIFLEENNFSFFCIVGPYFSRCGLYRFRGYFTSFSTNKNDFICSKRIRRAERRGKRERKERRRKRSGGETPTASDGRGIRNGGNTGSNSVLYFCLTPQLTFFDEISTI